VALGTYFFASKLILTPMTAIRSAFGAYLFPRFSRLQDDAAAVAGSYEFFLKAIAACVTPIMAGAAVAAPLLVPMLFRTKWSAAVPVIQIFTVVALVQAFMAPVGELMKALNRPGWMLLWSMGLSAIVAGAIAIGARFGIVGAATGLAVAHALALPMVYAITRRLIPTTLRSIGRAAIPSTVAAASLGLAMLLALRVAALPPTARIALAIILGSVSYVLVLRALDRDFVLTLTERLVGVYRGAHA
jgi:O-antigen/teichoic acid export membrane protein